jgi:hypothetical protein
LARRAVRRRGPGAAAWSGAAESGARAARRGAAARSGARAARAGSGGAERRQSGAGGKRRGGKRCGGKRRQSGAARRERRRGERRDRGWLGERGPASGERGPVGGGERGGERGPGAAGRGGGRRQGGDASRSAATQTNVPTRSNDRTGAGRARRFDDVRMKSLRGLAPLGGASHRPTPLGALHRRAPLGGATAVVVATALLAVVMLPLGCTNSTPPKCSAAGASASPCTRVLFVGNSYTYVNDLPTTFAQLAVAGGHNLETGMVANGGETLAQHAAAAETLDKIASAPWSFVVLQEQSETPATPAGRNSMYPAARTLAARVKADGAQPMFFMTWAHRDGLPVTGVSTYESMQLAIDDGYSGIADELGAPVAPVGFTWFVVRREHPEMAMWQDDGSHPTASGTYLAACVFYATIFRQSPEGLGYLGGLSSRDAHVLQAEAASSVLQNPAQWGLR